MTDALSQFYDGPRVPDVSAKLNTEVREATTVHGYLTDLLVNYVDMPVVSELSIVSHAIAPPDHDMSKTMHPTSFTFYIGGVLGLRTLEMGIDRAFAATVLDSALPIPEAGTSSSLEPSERRNKMAHYIITIADLGYAAATGYHSLIEYCEKKIVDEVANQIFFRRGFGFVLEIGNQVLAENAELDARVKAELDADAAQGNTLDRFFEIFGTGIDD